MSGGRMTMSSLSSTSSKLLLCTFSCSFPLSFLLLYFTLFNKNLISIFLSPLVFVSSSCSLSLYSIIVLPSLLIYCSSFSIFSLLPSLLVPPSPGKKKTTVYFFCTLHEKADSEAVLRKLLESNRSLLCRKVMI